MAVKAWAEVKRINLPAPRGTDAVGSAKQAGRTVNPAVVDDDSEDEQERAGEEPLPEPQEVKHEPDPGPEPDDEADVSDDEEFSDGGTPRPDHDIGQWLEEIGANPIVEDAFSEAEIDTLGQLAEIGRAPSGVGV